MSSMGRRGGLLGCLATCPIPGPTPPFAHIAVEDSRPLWQSESMMSEPEYQCCFCSDGIAETDRSALRINLSGIRGGKHGPNQDLFAHATCGAMKFGATLHASVPFDVGVFDPNN